MTRFEYMKMHISKFPAKIIEEYDLKSKTTEDGFIFMEIQKGMPGLQQAGRIANGRLTTHLARFGYHPQKITPSLWTHESRPIDFTLIVDNFGVKYVGKEHALHLLNALQQLYTVTEDWGGTLYSGLTIDWNYSDQYVDISMPYYIPNFLHRFQHSAPRKYQGAPHAWTTPTYGAKVQYATLPDESPLLPPSGIKTIQEQVGSLLYYGAAVDPFILVATGTIGSSQAKATEFTREECDWLMDYAASNPLSVI